MNTLWTKARVHKVNPDPQPLQQWPRKPNHNLCSHESSMVRTWSVMPARILAPTASSVSSSGPVRESQICSPNQTTSDASFLVSLLLISPHQISPVRKYLNLSVFFFHYKAFPTPHLSLSLCQILDMAADFLAIEQIPE